MKKKIILISLFVAALLIILALTNGTNNNKREDIKLSIAMFGDIEYTYYNKYSYFMRFRNKETYSLVREETKQYVSDMKKEKKKGLNAVFILGDITDVCYLYCMDELQEILLQFLLQFQIEYYVVQGNHDSEVGFNSSKPISNEMWKAYFDHYPNSNRILKDYNFITISKGSNCPTQEEIIWLNKTLKNNKDSFIFIHVPPYKFGNHPYTYNCVEFQEVIKQNKNVRAIFFGHVHEFYNCTTFDVPTCAVGRYDNPNGRYRILEIYENNSINTYMVN